MEKVLERVQFDVPSLKKQYEDHLAKCRKITEEVAKWGRKKKPDLRFLETKR